MFVLLLLQFVKYTLRRSSDSNHFDIGLIVCVNFYLKMTGDTSLCCISPIKSTCISSFFFSSFAMEAFTAVIVCRMLVGSSCLILLPNSSQNNRIKMSPLTAKHSFPFVLANISNISFSRFTSTLVGATTLDCGVFAKI